MSMTKSPPNDCRAVRSHYSAKRFATVKSEDARLDALAESPSFGDLDENNPASVARFMKKMGREFGDDLGDDFESAMDEAVAEGETAGEGEAESPGASDASDDQ